MAILPIAKKTRQKQPNGAAASDADIKNRRFSNDKTAPEGIDNASYYMSRARDADDQERFAAGIEWNTRALHLLDPSSWKAAVCLDSLTTENWRLGNLDEALVCGEQAHAIKTDKLQQLLDKHAANNNNNNNDGGAQQEPARPQEKDDEESDLEHRLELIKTRAKLATTLSNLGCVHLEKGNHKKALQLLTKVAAIREEGAPDSLDLAITYTNLGHALVRLGRDADAQEKYTQASIIKERVVPGSVSLARIYLSLASLSTLDKEAKLGFLQKAERVANEVPNKPGSLLAKINLQKGRVYLKAKQKEETIMYFELAIYQESYICDTSERLAAILEEVSKAYDKVPGQAGKGREYRKQANAIRKMKERAASHPRLFRDGSC